ncbi:hypothetical protein [Mycolicibacterium psychrotolerans]|uniref:Uncharacterized protein n=1 Tax=Mycolicibacterium psychrotolerans TaxID=216929 RepID=A0A7I7M3T8_9MYCO|nr:hypothetical protein [Mycolicibacterium psychrotolerans]BBX66542.1 hypothetical protein MPSYJ_00030 [Mycolicibacterium psychrotolerans]
MAWRNFSSDRIALLLVGEHRSQQQEALHRQVFEKRTGARIVQVGNLVEFDSHLPEFGGDATAGVAHFLFAWLDEKVPGTGVDSRLGVEFDGGSAGGVRIEPRHRVEFAIDDETELLPCL